jgi:hypothetical protein
MAKQPLGDVVVLLPGILGSVLQRDGKDVWAPSPGALGRGVWTLERSVTSLQLTSDPWTVPRVSSTPIEVTRSRSHRCRRATTACGSTA